ncbi:MAG: hypothetical protein RL318_2550 [Fibrobacterota bacterium]|jgi:hypothetical protein
MRILFPAVLGLGIVLSACSFGGSGTSAISTTESSGKRAIPASLRATCPKLPAGRIAARAQGEGTMTGPVTTPSNASVVVTYSIYDNAGSFVVQNSYTLNVSSPATLPDPGQSWNGTDARGNRVPTGHYFVFTEVRDEAGTLVGTKDICMGVVN